MLTFFAVIKGCGRTLLHASVRLFRSSVLGYGVCLKKFRMMFFTSIGYCVLAFRGGKVAGSDVPVLVVSASAARCRLLAAAPGFSAARFVALVCAVLACVWNAETCNKQRNKKNKKHRATRTSHNFNTFPLLHSYGTQNLKKT